MNNKTEEPLLEKTPLWQRKEGQSPTGGLTKAASEEVGLGRPVTEEPSKLKKGSKAAKRRKSFCARMGGMRKRQKDSNNTGKDRLSLSLKKWNCSTDINKEGMPTMSERQIKLENARIELAERCWSGYEPTPGKKAYSKGSCQPKGSSKKKKKVAEAREALAEKVLSEISVGALKRYISKAEPQAAKGEGPLSRNQYVGRAQQKVSDASEKGSPAQKAATGEHGNVGRSRTGTQTSLTAFGGQAGSSEDQKAANKKRKIPAGRITPEREKKLGDAADKFMGKPTKVDVNAPNASLDAEQAGKGRKSRRVARSNRDPEFAKTLDGKT